jgi:TRAP-type C4-dicarboxylate transport system substrate-binding protein
MSASKSNWRERLAALPPERQKIVKAAIMKTLRRRREAWQATHRENTAGQTLH